MVVAQQKRVTQSPFDFGLWTWTRIVTILGKGILQYVEEVTVIKPTIYNNLFLPVSDNSLSSQKTESKKDSNYFTNKINILSV